MAAELTDRTAPLWERLGAHIVDLEDGQGVRFAVWVPLAQRVSLVGDFNDWNPEASVLEPVGSSGVWTITVPELAEGALYKYAIIGVHGHRLPWKADPMAFGSEHPPRNSSVVRRIDRHQWRDGTWMSRREAVQRVDAPISIYEVHLGSWRRADGGRPLAYRELAEQLVAYALDLGFTHLELMPVSEHPYGGSWGYQPVGMYAPTIRHGTPEEFAAFVDAAHQAGLGVIADWVPAHFPTDEHGLGRFNGDALYEHADPREGFHQDWKTLIFDYGRPEVADYLISNALYWLSEYHLDGLRVDAVASMLYRDYSRADGEWIPNREGGRENHEAIRLLHQMNTRTYGEIPGTITVAEESTSFPGVTQPVHHGGLGFGYKWNIGWMNDALTYLGTEPVYRKYHHNELTFPLTYAFDENFILPISHDEVVHGKGSLYGRAPGSHQEKLDTVRAFLGYMWGHPGKKLLFMGQEFGQRSEWDHDSTIDWGALEDPGHAGVQSLVRDLNTLYRKHRALHARDTSYTGFSWIIVDDADSSVFAWARFGDESDPPAVVVVNFTPVERSNYQLGLPVGGRWKEALNTDSVHYGGQNRGNLGSFEAETSGSHGWPYSSKVVLPPLSTVIFTPDIN